MQRPENPKNNAGPTPEQVRLAKEIFLSPETKWSGAEDFVAKLLGGQSRKIVQLIDKKRDAGELSWQDYEAILTAGIPDIARRIDFTPHTDWTPGKEAQDEKELSALEQLQAMQNITSKILELHPEWQNEIDALGIAR